MPLVSPPPTNANSNAAIISVEEATRRHIKREHCIPETEAFVDCRLPGSMPKENFSMIGPGVTQSASQRINLREPHGFNIGAAGVHPGITNNLHLHFTSETFIAASGAYTLRWGVRGDEGELPVATGDIVCMPTWMFRGFSSASDDYGFLMTVLGGDDTGGIIWSPEVLKRARETGLWLTKDNMLVDARAGEPIPAAEDLLPLMPESDIAALKRWSVEAMRARVVTLSERDFRFATLDTFAGYRWELAPVVGSGLTQHREHHAKVQEPQGFSVEWMRVNAGEQSAPFTTQETMVIINLSEALNVTLNVGPQAVTKTLGPQDILSIPANVWRSFSADKSVAEAIMVLPGDQRKAPHFAASVSARARAQDVCIDAGGRIAKASLLPPAMLAPNAALAFAD